MGGGGEDPKEKPKKNVYTSQKEIDADNRWVQEFLLRKGAPNAATTIVGRNVGDAKPKFIVPNGMPMANNPMLKTVLPLGISINDVFQTNDGQYGYYHPQEGTFIQVDPQAIYTRYGAKK